MHHVVRGGRRFFGHTTAGAHVNIILGTADVIPREGDRTFVRRGVDIYGNIIGFWRCIATTVI